jgi:hypothetical protein
MAKPYNSTHESKWQWIINCFKIIVNIADIANKEELKLFCNNLKEDERKKSAGCSGTNDRNVNT